MLTNLNKTPWPWFGGKSDAAPDVWAALGDVDHYVEPFAGSLAVLMRRPHEVNRSYHSETVNDLDGLLVNAWRSMQLSPDTMADAASWPVSEADLHARHLALVAWKANRNLELLMADPAWHDPVMAGWWAWGQSCWIGSGWCSGTGGWTVGADGRITKAAKSGGVSRQLPHLGNDGKGVNHAGCREPGVSRKLPHLGDDGKGVNRPQAREPGVSRQLPHLGNDGKGVNHAGCREPGVSRQLPHLGDDGKGVNHAGCRAAGVEFEHEYHPMTMPELRRWFAFLSARLRHVRILNGDWKRALTGGASKTLPVRMGGHCGVFLDPPYADTASRAGDLYAHDCEQVAHAVREWALAHGDDPQYRIVLAGYDGEHQMPDGWREVEWYRAGFLKGGMANTSKDDEAETQQGRERLWMSPHCLRPITHARQGDLFGAVAS